MAWLLLLQVELHVQDGGVGVGVQRHVGRLLVIAEEERVFDDVGVEAFFDEVAFALLEGPRDLQGILWRWTVSSEMGWTVLPAWGDRHQKWGTPALSSAVWGDQRRRRHGGTPGAHRWKW